MKKKWRIRSHTVSGVFVFLLIGVFALTSLTLTLIGTQVYQRVTAASAHNIDAQMVLSYLCNKTRTFDSTGCIAVEDRDGVSALVLYESYDGDRYETSIFCCDGEIRERFASADEPFDPAEGQTLTQVQSLQFSQPQENLISAEIVLSDGERRSLQMALRSAAKEADAA